MTLFKNIAVLLTLLLTGQLFARPLTVEERACLFKTPVSFGASISAETAMLIPGYHSLLLARALARGILYLPPFGPSPTHILLGSYAHKWSLGTNLAKMFTHSQADLGSEQVVSMLSGHNQSVFNSASVVMSVDAFYWDAIWNNCGFGGPGVEKIIEQLITSAHAQGKTLILGNVPHENPSLVLIDSDSLGIPGLWYNPEPTCVDSINSTLQRLCTTGNGCYLINIDSMVSTLNKGESIPLDGKLYSQYWIRPDGVHLSIHGSEYVYQRIVEALESNPPICKSDDKVLASSN